MGGEPYTWRRVSTVRRQAVGNLPPKGGTAPTAEPTNNQREAQSGHGEPCRKIERRRGICRLHHLKKRSHET